MSFQLHTRLQPAAFAAALALAAFAAPGVANAGLNTLDGLAPVVIAHRGASGYLPEHTLGGYELAIKMGVDFIEPDLQLTKDGQLVAMHDDTLTRTTNVSTLFSARNGGYKVADFTLAEIKTLTVKPVGTAQTSYPGFTPSSLDPFKVPTFQEVVTFAKQQSALLGKEIGIYPEAKQADPVMEDKILQTLVDNGYNSSSKLFIQSFSADTIKSINAKQTAMGLDFKLIVLGSASSLQALGFANVASYADGLGLSISGNFDGASFIAAAHAANLAVHGWTFSQSNPTTADAQYQQWYGYGIDGVFSNYADLALASRDKFLAANVPEPSTYAMFALGLVGLAAFARRRKG